MRPLTCMVGVLLALWATTVRADDSNANNRVADARPLLRYHAPVNQRQEVNCLNLRVFFSASPQSPDTLSGTYTLDLKLTDTLDVPPLSARASEAKPRSAVDLLRQQGAR